MFQSIKRPVFKMQVCYFLFSFGQVTSLVWTSGSNTVILISVIRVGEITWIWGYCFLLLFFFFWYCAVGIISFLFHMSSLANKEDKKIPAWRMCVKADGRDHSLCCGYGRKNAEVDCISFALSTFWYHLIKPSSLLSCHLSSAVQGERRRLYIPT